MISTACAICASSIVSGGSIRRTFQAWEAGCTIAPALEEREREPLPGEPGRHRREGRAELDREEQAASADVAHERMAAQPIAQRGEHDGARVAAARDEALRPR